MEPGTAMALVGLFFLAGVSAILLRGCLSGRVNTRGLLDDKRTGIISGTRVQLLLGTLAGAAAFAFAVVGTQVEPGKPASLPAVPTELLALAAGSNALYLVTKVVNHLGIADLLRGRRP